MVPTVAPASARRRRPPVQPRESTQPPGQTPPVTWWRPGP